MWVGSAFLVGPALLALLAPGPLTPYRIAAACVLGGMGAAVVAHWRPRRRTVVVDGRAHTVSVDGARALPWDPASATLRLVAAPPRTAGGAPRYGVSLTMGVVGAGHRDVFLIVADDPAKALADVTTARAALSLPVHGGWGLPAASPWIDVPMHGAREDAPPAPLWDERIAKRRSATVLFLGAVAIGVGIARTVHARVELGQMPSALSLALPSMGVVTLLILGATVATLHWSLHVGDTLVSEKRWLGIRLVRRSVPRDAIRNAYVVSPDGGSVSHLVVDTTTGPLAFPCDDESRSKVSELVAPSRP
jgi:hypothetical protein